MIHVEPWQVWLADLDPSVGYEQGGQRPVVVVSSWFRISFPSRTTLVIPVTTRDRRLAHHVPITSTESGLDRPSWARTDDVQTASFKRFLRPHPLGRLVPQEIDNLRVWLADMFDFE